MTALVADALDANRAGRLTAAQRKTLGAISSGQRRNALWFAGLLTVMGLLVWFASGPPQYATVKPLVGIAFLIVAGFMVVRAFLGADSLTADLRGGRVESVEGAVTKWADTTDGARGSFTTYCVQVAQERALTSAGFYGRIPDAGIVRMFYLPHSRRLLNLEQLADRPLPAGALNDPRIAINDVKQALIGSVVGDPVKEAQARAELAAIGRAWQGQLAADATPPPASARDPRPLGEAIVGTWRNPMLTLVFAGDGTASMTSSLLAGMKREGRWSVDANGRLVADVAGSIGPADAWIVDGRLTVSMGRQALSFEKLG